MDAFGFDYDYTIADWNENIHSLIYDLTIKTLIQMGYPEDLSSFKYDPQFPIRGLFFDTKRGNLMKLDYLYTLYPGYIYFGRRPLTKSQIVEQYGGPHVSKTYLDHLRPLIDKFSMAEACVISDIIEYCSDKNSNVDPSFLYTDVSKAVYYVHASGLLHKEILKDLPKYLDKTDDLVEFFGRLKDYKKKTFLLTNSSIPFIDTGMKYLFGKSWNEMFDIVIGEADKPDFFLSERRPFRHYTLDGRASWEKVHDLEKGKFYIKGNFYDFHKLTKFKGHRTVFFGDNIYSDVKEPSRISGWRTVAILQELEDEMQRQSLEPYREALSTIFKLEQLAHKCELSNIDKNENFKVLREINSEISKLRKFTKSIFNSQFGSVFRTHTSPTTFAFSLQRYSDLYTSKISNFNNYPMEYIFQAQRQYLPHELDVRNSVLYDVQT